MLLTRRCLLHVCFLMTCCGLFSSDSPSIAQTEHSILLETSAGARGMSLVPTLAEPAKKWAFIVAVNKCEDQNIPTLLYCRNDATHLAETLVDFGGYEERNIMVLHDGQRRHLLKPTSDNVKRQFRELLRRVGPTDSLLIFFSGHGYLASDESLYFATSDCQKSNIPDTGYSLAKLRSLLEDETVCRARQKLLILDTCHAGAARGADDDTASVEEYADRFQNARGLITIASSGINQYSYEWPERKQGIFSYYLVEGLHGIADDNHDGVVDSGEIYEYVSLRVPETARQLSNGAKQEPRRMIGPDVVGNFALAQKDMPRDVAKLVERKRGALFRVEYHEYDDWHLAGTAFAFSRYKNRLFVATASSVLEDSRGRLRDKSTFRLRNQENPNRPLRIKGIYRGAAGPNKKSKIALVELTLANSMNSPEFFNLLPLSEEKQSILETAYLGFLNRPTCTLYSSCYRTAMITAVPIVPNVPYQFRPDHNKKDVLPGAPLFTVGDNSSNGQSKYEQVVGICLDVRRGDNMLAAPIANLRRLIEEVSVTEAVPLPTDPDLRVVIGSDGQPAVVEEVDAEQSMQQEMTQLLNKAFEQSVQLSRSREFRQASEVMHNARRNFWRMEEKAEDREAFIPWEYDALHGCILTHTALGYHSNKNRQRALEEFDRAKSYFDRAVLGAPGNMVPILLEARVNNNLGTPNRGKSLNVAQRRYLARVHDTMLTMLNNDKENPYLTDRQKAQCQYLLGYAHRYVGRECKGNPVSNFVNSYKLFPSLQVQRQFRDLGTAVPRVAGRPADIWDEFDTLLQQWQTRSSTDCPTCNELCSACS